MRYYLPQMILALETRRVNTFSQGTDEEDSAEHSSDSFWKILDDLKSTSDNHLENCAVRGLVNTAFELITNCEFAFDRSVKIPARQESSKIML